MLTGITAPTPKLRWFQFSLRTLLVFVTLCAILCSLGVCTHWVVSATFGVAIVSGGIAGRIVSKALVRNILVFPWAITTHCVLDYLYWGCHMSAIGQYDALLFYAPLYFAIVWANWNLFGNKGSPFSKWLGRVFVSALLFPLYAFIIIIVGLCFHVAMGFRIPFG
jgi:hypothetical protein